MITLRTLSLAERDSILAVKPAYPTTLSIVAKVEWPESVDFEDETFHVLRLTEQMHADIGVACQYRSESGHTAWLALNGTVWLAPKHTREVVASGA